MNKRKIRQLVSLYIDNELSTEEKKRVESNIQQFDEWHQEYNAFKRLQDTLDSLPRLSVGQNFLKDLHTEIEKYNTRQSRRIIMLPALIKFSAAAVIVLALVVSYKLYFHDRNTLLYTHSLEKNTADNLIASALENEKEMYTDHPSVSASAEPIHSVSATADQTPQDFPDEMIVLYEPSVSAPEVADAQGTSIPFTKIIHSDGSVEHVYNPDGIPSIKFPSDPEKYRITFSNLEKALTFYNGYILLEDTPVQSIIKARIPSNTLHSFIEQLNETGKTTSVLSPQIDRNNINAIDADNDNYITLKIFLDLNK